MNYHILKIGEHGINVFPPGVELNCLIHSLLRRSGKALDYGTDEDASDALIPFLEENCGFYQVSEWFSKECNVGSLPGNKEGILLNQYFVRGYDGIANPWGWGETRELARCRFFLKAICYREMNHANQTPDSH